MGRRTWPRWAQRSGWCTSGKWRPFGGRSKAVTRAKKTLTNNAIAKTVSFFPHLREQVHQFALHVDGLKGELLTGAVQKSRCDVLQRVRNRLQAVYLVTDHCTRKNHPWRAGLEKRYFTSPFGNSGRTFRKILGIYLASPKGEAKRGTWSDERSAYRTRSDLQLPARKLPGYHLSGAVKRLILINHD